MHLITEPTFAQGYKKILFEIFEKPDFKVKPRGYLTHEVSPMIFQLTNPLSNMFTNEVRSPDKRYLAGELFWYLSGKNDVAFISKYSKFWEGLANPDEKTVNSNYGYLLFTESTLDAYTTTENDSFGPFCRQARNQWSWAFQSLANDQDTRQAILHFNKPHHQWQGNKDFPCTLIGDFHIRNGKLNFTIVMRSQDELLGRTYDLPFFTILQQQMLSHLKPVYPWLELGVFNHINLSSHIYEKDFGLVSRMLEKPFVPAALPPLQVDLIDTWGKPTDALLNNIAHDPLIAWIAEHMAEEKKK